MSPLYVCGDYYKYSDTTLLALHWTTAPPTEPGWYWICYPDGEIACIDVNTTGGNLTTDSDYVLDTVTHWLGPLPQPEPPEGD